MTIKFTPVSNPKNTLVIEFENMHGDADAYTYEQFHVNVPIEKKDRIGEILSFLEEKMVHFQDDEWGWDDDEEESESESESEGVAENQFEIDGYDMTFVIDGIRVSVSGCGDATTDGMRAACTSINEIYYYDEHGNKFTVSGY